MINKATRKLRMTAARFVVFALLTGYSLWNAGVSLAAPVEPESTSRLHLLTIESRGVAGADVDASLVNALASDWVSVTSPQNAGFRSRWQQNKPAGPGGIRGVVLGKIDEFRQFVRPDDIVFFFYTGHGATDQNERHLLQFDDGGTLHRDELVRRLRGLGCRLTVVVTDCCAVRIKLPPVPESEVDPMPPIQKHRQLKENLARLFATRGVYDLNSSSLGQIAWGTHKGGLFTRQMAGILRSTAVRDWDHFTREVTKATDESYAIFREGNLEDPNGGQNFSSEEVAQLREQRKQTPQRFLHPAADMEEAARPPQPPKLGVLITRVNPNTAAAKMNLNGTVMTLEVGDRILSINGRAIENANHFGEVIDTLPRGATIVVDILSGPQQEKMQLRGKLDTGGNQRLGVVVNDR